MTRCILKMRGTFLKLLAASTVGAIALSESALAGGFINQSQSTVFNGMAYAGYAAPGSSSIATMFLNPATMTTVNRLTIDSNYTLVIPSTRITGTGGVAPAPGIFVPAFGTGSSGDIAQDALVPATYVVYPFSDRLFFGISLNAPYGNVTKPAQPWVGQLNSMTTKAKTITITPQFAYKFSEMFSAGIGLQIQNFKAKFISGTQPFPIANPTIAGLEGSGWSFGITAGVTVKPWAGTQIGLGYRSRIDQEIKGHYLVSGPAPLMPLNNSNIRGTLKLPDRLNLSFRQTINPQFDFLGSAEWQGWGRIGTARLAGPLVPFSPVSLQAISFEYKDGWFFALGGEYKYNQDLMLRAGVAYELAPIKDAVRSTRLPDNDRIWTSIGASYQLSERIAINASYSHVFVKNANIAVAQGNPAFGGPPTNAAFLGRARSHVDIFSVGLTTRWGTAKIPGVVAKY